MKWQKCKKILDELNIGPSRERAYKDGALTKAGEGFLKAHRIEEEQIEIIKNDKGEYIAFKRFQKGNLLRLYFQKF